MTLFIGSIASHVEAAPAETATKQIVVLYWYGRTVPANVRFELGFQQSLDERPGEAEYFPEYLESNRFPGDEQSEILVAYLANKYAGRRIDAVVAVSSTALNFLLKHRSELFSNVPIVFHTFQPPAALGAEKMTGVTVDRVFRKTLELALGLHPRTQEVFVIIGTPEGDRILEMEVRDELQGLERRARLTYLSDMPLPDLIARVHEIADGSVIFYVRQSQDEPGKPIGPSDMLSVIAAAAKVPVYSLAGGLIGSGSVGGYAIDEEAVGAMVGKMALDVARGTPPAEMPPVAAATYAMFDWRQLQRWGIDARQLPAGSSILFRPVPAWIQYRKYVILTATVFGGQLLLIGGLVLQRRRRQAAEQALRRSEERYRNVIDTQSEFVCRFLPDTTLTFVNDAYCRFWNKRRDELIGSRFITLIPEDSRELVLARIQNAARDRVSRTHQHEVLLAGGDIGWQEWTNHPVVDRDGTLVELQGVGRDISEQKRSAAALRETEARTSAILRALPDLMFLFSFDGVYLDYHARNPRDLFVPPEQFLGRRIPDVMPPELAAQFMAALNRALESSEPVVMDYSLPMFDGERHYEMRMVRGEHRHIVCVVRDMTDRRRAEALLGESREVLRLTADRNVDLAGRLIASQEEERRRMARELHDDLSQKLALLAIRVDQLGQEANLTRRFTDLIREVSRQSAEIASDVHRMSLQLHPSKLEALGLVAALESVCSEVSAQHGVAVEYSHDDVPDDLHAEVSLCLYRVTQEALHNVVKHSGARRASVRLTRDGDDLYLQIADPGAGFDTRVVEHSGLGLVSMRERANFLGGRVVIYSAPGQGTRIGVRVPLSPERRARGIERRSA